MSCGNRKNQAALELANQHRLSIALIPGTGDLGRILVRDVQAYVSMMQGAEAAAHLDESPVSHQRHAGWPRSLDSE